MFRERGELIEQLNAVSRQKAALAEELVSACKEIDRQSDTIVRIAKEKESLTRNKVELAVSLTASERENRQQSEALSALRADKDSLEGALRDAQQTNAVLDTRKEQLEGENQELLIRREHLQGQLGTCRGHLQERASLKDIYRGHLLGAAVEGTCVSTTPLECTDRVSRPAVGAVKSQY